MATAKKSKPKTTPTSKQATVREIMSFDFAMKGLLRDKANAGILEGFLTELIGSKVKVLAILESEGNVEAKGDKVNRVDIKAQLDNGEIAIFEIQYADLYDFFGKMLFNVGRAIVEQIKTGDSYDVKKIYMIGIAEFDIGAKREYLFNAKMGGFKGVHYDESIPFAQTRGGRVSAANPKVDIHPEYYLILPKMFDDEIRGRFDEWVYALKNHAVKSDFKAAGIKEAGAKMDMIKMTPAERLAHAKHLHNKNDIDVMLRDSLIEGREEGRAEGREEGRAEGRAEGEVIGIAKGKAEGEKEKAKEIARAMKAKGMDVQTISEITGLTAGEIEKL